MTFDKFDHIIGVLYKNRFLTKDEFNFFVVENKLRRIKAASGGNKYFYLQDLRISAVKKKFPSLLKRLTKVHNAMKNNLDETKESRYLGRFVAFLIKASEIREQNIKYQMVSIRRKKKYGYRRPSKKLRAKLRGSGISAYRRWQIKAGERIKISPDPESFKRKRIKKEQ